MLDDTMLLEGLRANDPQAWEELVGRFGDRLLRAASFHGECAIGTWLSAILRNVARTSRRRTPWLRFVGVLPEPEPTSAACPRIS
jgi:hypothetical protein